MLFFADWRKSKMTWKSSVEEVILVALKHFAPLYCLFQTVYYCFDQLGITQGLEVITRFFHQHCHLSTEDTLTHQEVYIQMSSFFWKNSCL